MRPISGTMRSFSWALLLLFLSAPAASAAGSSLRLSGPSSLTLSDPVEVPVRARLVLDGVVCREEALVPVTLRVTRALGADAALSAETFRARVPAGAGVQAREATATLALKVTPLAAGDGVIDLEGSYQLPPECAAVSGEASGEAALTIRLRVVETETPMQAAQDGDNLRPVELRKPIPGPIIAVAAASAGGAILVAWRRVRGAIAR